MPTVAGANAAEEEEIRAADSMISVHNKARETQSVSGACRERLAGSRPTDRNRASAHPELVEI